MGLKMDLRGDDVPVATQTRLNCDVILPFGAVAAPKGLLSGCAYIRRPPYGICEASPPRGYRLRQSSISRGKASHRTVAAHGARPSKPEMRRLVCARLHRQTRTRGHR